MVVVVVFCAIFFGLCILCVYVCFLTILALAFWPYSAQFEPRTRPEQAGQRSEESRECEPSRAEIKRDETNRNDREAKPRKPNANVCRRSWRRRRSSRCCLCPCLVRLCASVFAVSPFERRFIKIRFSFCALIQFVPCCRVEVAGDGRVTKVNLSQKERNREREKNNNKGERARAKENNNTK